MHEIHHCFLLSNHGLYNSVKFAYSVLLVSRDQTALIYLWWWKEVITFTAKSPDSGECQQTADKLKRGV